MTLLLLICNMAHAAELLTLQLRFSQMSGVALGPSWVPRHYLAFTHIEYVAAELSVFQSDAKAKDLAALDLA